MRKPRQLFILSLAVIVGCGSFIASSVAQGDTLMTLCYRGTSIQVPFYLAQRYLNRGATNGPCAASQ